MKIVLHQLKPMFGLPNPSPFCMKLEIYLRMAGLQHEVATITDFKGSPTGKVPYVTLDGQAMADSGLIIAHLERTHGHPVDGKLTLAQRAETLAFQRLMDEHLYWVALYMRWADPNRRAESIAYFRDMLGVPGFLAPLFFKIGLRGLVKSLHAHGMGRHDPETLWQMGITDIQALAHWLGSRTWGFNDTPTTFDACLAAFVGTIVRTPWDSPLKAATCRHTTLVAHFERVVQAYFPELAEPQKIG